MKSIKNIHDACVILKIKFSVGLIRTTDKLWQISSVAGKLPVQSQQYNNQINTHGLCPVLFLAEFEKLFVSQAKYNLNREKCNQIEIRGVKTKAMTPFITRL